MGVGQGRGTRGVRWNLCVKASAHSRRTHTTTYKWEWAYGPPREDRKSSGSRGEKWGTQGCFPGESQQALGMKSGRLACVREIPGWAAAGWCLDWDLASVSCPWTSHPCRGTIALTLGWALVIQRARTCYSLVESLGARREEEKSGDSFEESVLFPFRIYDPSKIILGNVQLDKPFRGPPIRTQKSLALQPDKRKRALTLSYLSSL